MQNLAAQKLQKKWSEANLKAIYYLWVATKVSPEPPGKCICSTFAQVCNPVGTVATVMKIVKCKTTTYKVSKVNEVILI